MFMINYRKNSAEKIMSFSESAKILPALQAVKDHPKHWDILLVMTLKYSFPKSRRCRHLEVTSSKPTR